jgi:hypothetical protein
MEVPKAIRENIAFLVQEIYRMAFLKATRESLQAETAEAIRLKQDDLNDFLVSIADACQQLELKLIRFWCGWTSPDEAAADTLFESLELSVIYSREFFLADLGDDLKNWALGLKMDLGKTMEKRIRMRAAFRLEPLLDDKEKKTVEDEIEAIANKPKPDPMAIAASLRAGAGGRASCRRQKPEPPPKPADGAGGMSKIARLQRAAEREAEIQDFAVQAFERQLQLLVPRFLRRLRSELTEWEIDEPPAAWSAPRTWARADVPRAARAWLEEEGFIDLALEVLGDPLDEIAKSVLATSRIANEAAKLSGFTDALNALKELRLADLLDISDDIARELSRITFEGMLSLRPSTR